MKIKTLWTALVLSIIGPALDERDRRQAEAERLRVAALEKRWREAIAPLRAAGRAEERNEFEELSARWKQRRAARAAESAAVPRVQ